MFRGLTSIMYKEFIHILRDPRSLFLMILVPGLQLTIFGYAIDLDVKDIATVVYNLDGRRESRELLDTFANSGYFRFVDQVFSDADLISAIVQGKARVAIKVPRTTPTNSSKAATPRCRCSSTAATRPWPCRRSTWPTPSRCGNRSASSPARWTPG